MRVTDKMIFESAALRTGQSREEVENASREVSTGVRVQHPWDDPTAAALLVNHRANGERMAGIGQAAQRTSDELVAADGALSTVNDLLGRARELATQFSNDTYSAADRFAGSKEAEALLKQAIAISNTQYGGRYVFAGYKDNVAPFDPNGGYVGDSGIRQVEIAPGQLQEANLPGDMIFTGGTGGVDLFATLRNLADSLESNSTEGVRSALNGIEKSVTQVTDARARLGTAANVFDSAVATSRLAKDAETAAVTNLADADVFASASRLALAQRALDAALTASARSFQLSLLDKLS